MRTIPIALLMVAGVVAHCSAPIFTELPEDTTPLPQEDTPEQPVKVWSEEGIASRYSASFNNHIMANGRKFNQVAMTCAHRFLPFGTWIWVESHGKRVCVMVTDRGPFKKGRIVDLSFKAAKLLGIIHAGISPVRVTLCPTTAP